MSAQNDAVLGDSSRRTEGEVVAPPPGRWLEEIVGMGRLWAKHGLTVGSSALDVSARTLQSTADLLRDMSGRVGEASAGSHLTGEGEEP